MSPLSPIPRPEEADALRPCPYGECEGDGLIVDEESNTARPCRCRGRLIGQAATRRTRSTVPRAYRNVSFDRPPLDGVDPAIKRHVETYLRGLEDNLTAGRGLWFFGDDDDAKAGLAMFVARKALEQGWSVAIYTVPRLLAELRATFESDSPDSYLQLFERLCAVDLLVLTDLGAQRQTEWVLEQMHSLVNERWQDGRALVVTSGVPERERDDLEHALSREISELRSARTKNRGEADLSRIAERLEGVVQALRGLESRPWADPIDHLRRQVGTRTVARLVAICDDPIPVMGPDVQLSSAV
ncbi:MAG: hypothetical protein WKF32_01425 [Thermoleophilaceae bacterium]